MTIDGGQDGPQGDAPTDAAAGTLSRPLYLGRPAIGAPGSAASEVRPGLPVSSAARPDVGLSLADGDFFQALAVTARGILHEHRGQVRQDSFAWGRTDAGGVVAAVADGVGSLPDSHLSADFAASTAVSLVCEGNSLAEAVLATNAELSQRRISGATTLVLAEFERTDQSVTMRFSWIGDSPIWLLADREWRKLTTDPGDEGANAAYHSSKTRALPDERVTHVFEAEQALGADDIVLLMSDGVGVPLEGALAVRERLADWWSTYPNPFDFAAQVSFVRASHMDDRTVVGVWLSPDADQPTDASTPTKQE